MRCYLILGVIKTVNVFVAPESAEDELKSTKVNVTLVRYGSQFAAPTLLGALVLIYVCY